MRVLLFLSIDLLIIKAYTKALHKKEAGFYKTLLLFYGVWPTKQYPPSSVLFFLPEPFQPDGNRLQLLVVVWRYSKT